MGCVHIQELEKPTQELGKKGWEQGGTEFKASHINCFCQIFCLFQICLSFICTTAGRPQPISPECFFIENQNNFTKIILFRWCGQIEMQAPNYASAFTLPGAEAYVICLTSLAHPPSLPTSLLPTSPSLVGILFLPPLYCIMPREPPTLLLPTYHCPFSQSLPKCILKNPSLIQREIPHVPESSTN